MSSETENMTESKVADEVCTIVVAGNQLEPESAESLYAAVRRATDSGVKHVVINLGHVKSIKSSAIAVLLRLQKQLKDVGGLLKLCEIDADVLRLLKLTHSDQLFVIHETQLDAVAAFRGGVVGDLTKRRRTFSRRKLLAGVGAAIALPIGIEAFGYDPDRLTVTRHRIEVPGLEKPTTAVQISDLHADRAGSCSSYLRDQVAKQVDQLAPDWIFATGDFVTHPGDSVEDAVGWVASLKSKEGIFAVMGNHDYQEVATELKAKGIEQLYNAWTSRRGIVIAGVNDPTRGASSAQRALKNSPRGVGTIMLAHQPDTFWTYDDPVTLQLSGHTHGGQVTLFGAVELSRFMPKLKQTIYKATGYEPIKHHSFRETRHNAWSGFFRRPGQSSLLYVNRGLGRFKRVSVYCPPEMTIWELVPA